VAMKRARRERTLAELDEAVAGLARVVERHSRMVGGHDGEIRRVAAVVEQLSARLTAAYEAWTAPTGHSNPDSDLDEPARQAITDGQESGEEPTEKADSAEEALPSWLVTTDWYEAEEMMSLLAPWVEQVYLRWPDVVLPSCWALHPHAVEELWWLCCAWLDARTGEGKSWMKVGDWHDRQRPAVAKRLREALEDCSLAEHADRTRWAHPTLPGADTVPQALTAWATEDHASWPPHLSEQQIADDQPPQNSSTRAHTSSTRRRTLTPQTSAHNS
jgi:hypothetical protein